MAYYLKAAFWYMKGCSWFGKSGFEKSAVNFKPIQHENLNGVSFMVTGGSSGIGKAVAESLVKKDGTIVHIVCRNPENGNQALEYLKDKASPSSKVFLHLVNLGEPKEVKDFAIKFMETGNKINVLINNAGVLKQFLDLTSMKLEDSFSLNVLGTYILTNLFIQHMLNTSDNFKSRIIFVSSGGMLTSNLNSKNPEYFSIPFDGVSAYAHHKRQQVVMCDILAEKYPQIKFSSMHPGWVDTPGVEKSLPNFYETKKNDLRTTEQGADTIVWLAISKEALEYPSGSFFFDRHKTHKFLFSSDERYSKNIEEEYISSINEILKRISINI